MVFWCCRCEESPAPHFACVQLLQPIRLIPAYWVCPRGTLPRWQATAVRCGTCKAVRGGRYCLCTTPLLLAGRLAGCWLPGRAWLAAYLQQEISSVSRTVVRYSELYRYRFTRHLGKISGANTEQQ